MRTKWPALALVIFILSTLVTLPFAGGGATAYCKIRTLTGIQHLAHG